MKPLLQIFTLISITSLSIQARTWRSANGEKTMVGELVSYDLAPGKVEIQSEEKVISFNWEFLSADDIAFLNKKHIPAAAPEPTMAPTTSLSPTAISIRPTLGISGSTPINTKAATAPADKPDYTFKPAPLDKGKPWLIQNFGPVGIGITLEKGLVMKIKNVEPGSPAEKNGQLKAGDVIESINGVKLSETKRDPRIVLGQLITDAEASDGKIGFMIEGKGPVLVQIPVLGAYSATWPLNCPKSDKIVRNLADLLAKQGRDAWGSILFLLSTGEEKDLEVVRGWIKERPNTWEHNWAVGLKGIGICEYYLRTGDASALPMIQSGADHLRDRIYNGGWSGRGASFNYQAGGHLNAAGVHCVTFLMLAQTCGVKVDEKTFQSSLSHFFDYSGKGSVPYGDFIPKPGFSDCNGKTGGLAMAMAVAARLSPDGQKSIYAKAAQTNASKAYYGTHDYCMGHTGGGIGELWKSAGVQLIADKRPKQHREYMDARRWALELARRHNGGIGVAGGEESNYDRSSGEGAIDWGTFNALNYTASRKHLHIFGAPLSKWAKSYQMPIRPRDSVAADDDFSSPLPVPGGPWTDEAYANESLMKEGGWYVWGQLQDKNVTDETILYYLHHPEISHRFEAMGAMLRNKKDKILLDLLLSKDARLRHIGIMAMNELWGTWRPSNDETKARITPEMMSEVDKMIRNPEESPFNRAWAIGLLQHADLTRLRTFRELLVELMSTGTEHVMATAINVSNPLLTDPESYQIIFPPIMKAISSATDHPTSVRTAWTISKAMEKASPEIQAYGLKQLQGVYKEQPAKLISKDTGIYTIPDGMTAKLKALGVSLGFSEEGRQFMKLIPKTTLKSYITGKDSDKFVFSGKFENDKKYLGKWNWAVWPNPKNPAQIDSAIQDWLKKRGGNPVPTDMKDVITLYEDGRVESRGYYGGKHKGQYFWTKDTMFGVNTGEAVKMEIRTYNGHDFLIVECGDFAPAVPKTGEVEAKAITADYHCGYHVYSRAK